MCVCVHVCEFKLVVSVIVCVCVCAVFVFVCAVPVFVLCLCVCVYACPLLFSPLRPLCANCSLLASLGLNRFFVTYPPDLMLHYPHHVTNVTLYGRLIHADRIVNIHPAARHTQASVCDEGAYFWVCVCVCACQYVCACVCSARAVGSCPGVSVTLYVCV